MVNPLVIDLAEKRGYRSFDPATDTLPGPICKAGCVAAGSFAGNPKRFTVTFTTAFPDATYSIALEQCTTGTTVYPIACESKTAAGFTILVDKNNIANLTEICWQAKESGEF